MSIRLLFSSLVLIILHYTGYSQQKWRYSKERQEFRKIANARDVEVQKKKLEEAIARIPQKKQQHQNLRISYSLQLAEIYSRMGELSQAEKLGTSLVEQVRREKPKWSKSILPGFKGTVYDAYDKLAYFYLVTGNFRKAEQLFQESKSVRDSIYPGRSVFRIHPIVGMGSLHYRKGEYDKTYQLFSEAIKMLNRATTTFYDYDNVSRLFLNDLAEICLMQGRNVEAWDYINKLSLSSSGIGKFGSRLVGRVEIARVFELKARYYLLEGDFERAQDYLDRANEFYTTTIASSDVKFKLQKTQALVYWYQGNIQKSNETFLSLIESYRLHINQNFISMSEYEKEQFYNILKNDFNLFNAYAMDRYAENPTQLYEKIYDNTLNTKALLLNESNKIRNNIIKSGNLELTNKLHQWERSKAQLSSFYFDKDAFGKIDSLEKKIESLEKEINAESRLFGKKENPPVWQQVQAVLKSNEAAIEIIRVNTINKQKRNAFDEKNGLSDSTIYLVMIIKAGLKTPTCIFLSNGNQLEKRFITFYRNSIFSRSEDKLSYDQFWRPIKKELSGVKRIYLSPDGVFNQINLNALKNPVNQEYLLDEVELVYLTNTGDLLRQKSEIVAEQSAVLFGRPSYDFEVKADYNSTAEPPAIYAARNLLTDELASFKEQEFVDLPGTEIEIVQIEEALKRININVTSFKGSEALEENVKAINNPAILHIATHGFFVEDSANYINPMIRSGLVLAGVKNQEQAGMEDGILTAYEATNLNLEGTSLVALSACETGLGELRNGEGVYGLQRAMIVAGANNLLMSLWKVDDAATALLMIEVYKAWGINDNQVAFRNAQKILRIKYPEPFYWGAFIMLGK